MTLRAAWYGRGSLLQLVDDVEGSFVNHPAKFLHDGIGIGKLVIRSDVGLVSTFDHLLRVDSRTEYGVQLASEFRPEHCDRRILWSKLDTLHDVF